MLPSNHLGFQATSLHVTNGNLRPTEGKVQTQNTGLLSSPPGCQEGQQDTQNSPAPCSTGRPLLAILVTAPTSQKTRQSWPRRSREGHVDEDSNTKTERIRASACRQKLTGSSGGGGLPESVWLEGGSLGRRSRCNSRKPEGT